MLLQQKFNLTYKKRKKTLNSYSSLLNRDLVGIHVQCTVGTWTYRQCDNRTFMHFLDITARTWGIFNLNNGPMEQNNQMETSKYRKITERPELCPGPGWGAYWAPLAPLLVGRGLAAPSPEPHSATRGGLSHGHGRHAQKTGVDQSHSSRDIHADTQKHTDWLITVFHNPTRPE